MPGTTEDLTSGSTNNSSESGSISETSTPSLPSDDPLFQEPIQPKTWQEKAISRQILIRQAHEGMMLGKIMRQNKIVQDQVKNSLGQGGESGNDMGDEEMLSIGNETHYHYQTTPPAPQAAPASSAQPTSTASKLAYAALAAAALGGPAATWYLMSGEENPATPPPQVSVDTDTDTFTDVLPGFGVPQDVD